jgi:hypothetical protein
MLAAAQPTCFLIADISGYTSYLAGVELDHAQDIMADLVGTIVTALRPTFRLAKLEGDAAFTYAPADKVDGTVLLDAIVTVNEQAFGGVLVGRLDFGDAVAQGAIRLSGPPDLVRAFPTWLGMTRFATYARSGNLVPAVASAG